MKILGLGVPEMLIMLMLLVPVALVVALIVVLAKRAGSQQPLPDERQRASALAYQRLSQLDDLYKRGAITEEEYVEKAGVYARSVSLIGKAALMGFMDGFERGLSGNYRYEIAGKAVVCSHCGGEEFDERSGQLNTAGASLLNLDWANATARVLVCQSCGHLEWFL